MDTLKMIDQRHSVRAYLQQAVEPEKVAALRQEAARINAETGLHVQYIEDASGVYSSLMLRFAGWKNAPAGYFALVGPAANNVETEHLCGYHGEHLALLCQSLGLGTCWVGMSKEKYVTASILPGEKLYLTIAVGYAENPGRPHKSKSRMQVCDQASAEFAAANDWFAAGVDCALKAPTAINQQKFIFSVECGNPVVRASGKGPFINVDLGIAAYHFEAASGRKVKIAS